MIIDRLFSILFAILVFFYGSLMLQAEKQEQTVETYAADAVDEFVNKTCATGIITPSSYEEFVSRLDSTGVTYRIYLVHQKETVEPTVSLENGENKSQVGSYEQYYLEKRNQEILDTLFPDPPTTDPVYYYMEEGDFFKVVIENNSPTFAKRWRKVFTTNKSDTPTILVSRAGYVGNQVQKED